MGSPREISHGEHVMAMTLFGQLTSGKWLPTLSSAAKGRTKSFVSASVQKTLTALLRAQRVRLPRTAWLMRSQCAKVSPALNRELRALGSSNVRVRDADSVSMSLSVRDIIASSFKRSLYSERCTVRGTECALHFRCYKKGEMFGGFIATQKNVMPSNVSRIELRYGLYFAQLAIQKWDRCTLSNAQLYKGSSLFKMELLKGVETAHIEIAFHVMAVYDARGNRMCVE